MKDLEPLDFTVELGRFYEKARTSGTVSVTMKRMTESRIKKAAKVKKMTPKGGEAVLSSDKKNDEQLHYPCLVRAQFKNEKISTIVADKDFEKFHEAYTTVIKAHMDTLKKKVRNKKKKSKATGAGAAAAAASSSSSPSANQ